MEKFTNIAGSPFQDYVNEQIEVRKNFINKFSNSENLNNNHVIYQNNRNAWIRLTSNTLIKSDNKLTKEYNITDPISFSKKYILQGGLVEQSRNIINRSGIGVNKQYGILPERPLGLKPMPGITSIDVSSAGKLGTLQYANIKFICYDIKQLEIMDSLYMKLGFSLFLEWGHTYYLPNNNPNKLEQISPLDIFSYNSKEQIIKAIQNKRIETSGNYDAMLGTISNFGWETQSDGSYLCDIKLVGAGDVLESLKINQAIDKNTDFSSNSNVNIDINGVEEINDIIIDKSISGDKDLSLLNRALYEINTVILSKSNNNISNIGINNEDYRKVLNKIFSKAPIKFINFNENGDLISEDPLVLKGYHYSLLNNLEANPNNIPDVRASLFNGFSIRYNITDASDNTSESQPQTYITLGNLLCLLTSTGMIYDSNNSSKGNPYIYCDFNDRLNYCKTFKGQVSLNPLICLVPRNQSTNEDPFELGIIKDKIFNFINKKEIEDWAKIDGVLKRITNYNNPTRLIINYLNTPNPKIKARLMHILVNIKHLTDILRDLRNKDEKGNVAYSDFLNQLLSDISKSLGGFNEFRILIDDSSKSFRIIDDNKLNDTQESDNLKYTELPIFGKNSIIYDYSFKSKIGPKMASMVTIAAQAEPSALGEDSFAISNLSRGLEDRLMIKKLTANDILQDRLESQEKEIKEKEKQDENIKNNQENLKSLSTHLKNILEGDDNGFIINQELIEPSYNTYKDIIAKFNIKNNPINKGTTIIPLDFSVTMDGLSGILPNSAFIIPTNLLPSDYKTKNGLTKVAFILHSINQDFSGNKWVTKITGQALNIRFDEDDNKETPIKIYDIPSDIPQINKIFQISGCSRRAAKFFEPSTVNIPINYLKSEAQKLGLISPQSIASLIAIAAGESGLIPKDESHIYSEERIRQIFPNLTPSQYKRASKKGINKKDFFNIVYGEYKPSRIGNRNISDGGKYYGRGYIQLTGYGNYKKYAKLSGIDIINKPELVNDPVIGAKISAIYFKDRVNTNPFNENYFEKALEAVGYNVNDIKRKKIEYYNCYINKV